MRRLLWGAALLTSTAFAVPSVDVDLRTAFNAPPYLVELLETAAEENATAYFPLLDTIADGYFDSASTDQELYTEFREVLQKDGHLSRAEDLSSFDLALSIHSAAPRIQAHFQYYNTSAASAAKDGDNKECETWAWVPFTGQRFCSPDMADSSARALGEPQEAVHDLPFDRILGDVESGMPSILYADITSQSFRQFHKTLSKTAKEGKTSYRVRYKPVVSEKPLTVSGYGVELALKRTDYIVIDDRQAESEQKDGSTASSSETTLSEEDVSDLRPLSSSELLRLGLKASSFVMSSESPFDTLLKLSQDFPKHSGAIAGFNVTEEFLYEHRGNREAFLPSGFNVLWINGVQIMARDIDAFALLEHLRHERKMINSVRELGLSGPQAIDLLSNEAITAASVDQQPQRYDWRDETEGGDIIMWLNDIEKDKRYADWATSILALLQRTYPGQLPPVRKNIHHMVMTVDFSDYSNVAMVVENIQNFVKRKIPIRFGLVPRYKDEAGEKQAKIVYYLLDRYGLTVALDYLSKSAVGAGRKFGPPQEKYFAQATSGKQLRGERVILSFEEILSSDEFDSKLQGAKAYMTRFGSDQGTQLMLMNGIALPTGDEWLQAMSQRVGVDSRQVQQAVFEEQVNEASWLPEIFLVDAALRRNPLIVPENDKDVRCV
jgi:UDP-glucose:glycoprotein glucosyltransferase